MCDQVVSFPGSERASCLFKTPSLLAATLDMLKGVALEAG